MNKYTVYVTIIAVLFVQVSYSFNYSQINLPDEHLPYYFYNFPQSSKKCEEDSECPYKSYINHNKCWGYEPNCEWTKQYSIPSCPGDHKGWVKTKFAQQTTFHTQADFGYVK